MNTTQIKCFLTLADTLNFTKAADRLYISQPGLSRQIVSMERELNTQLFIRDQKSVRLTPAATLLARELGGISGALEDLLARVQTVGRGYSGILTVGVLESQWVGTEFTGLCQDFMLEHPNIDLRICQGSFGDMRRKLIDGEIDVSMTLRFDAESMDGVVCRSYDSDFAVFALSHRLPLAQKEEISLEDIVKETMIFLAPEDCRAGTELLLRQLESLGLRPSSVRYAPNRATVALWIEAGLGVGVVNYHSGCSRNPSIRIIPGLLPKEPANNCIVWRKDNLNPAIALFDQAMARHLAARQAADQEDGT